MDRDELLKQFLILRDFLPYSDVFGKESDQGKVLVSHGYLEQLVEDVLFAFIRDIPESRRLCEGRNAPLSTFHSQVTACYSLGLITESEHHDLQLIRKIRNEFAHHIHTSFETQSVIDRCALFKHQLSPEDRIEETGNAEVGPSHQFSEAAVILIWRLTTRPHSVAEHRRTEPIWDD